MNAINKKTLGAKELARNIRFNTPSTKPKYNNEIHYLLLLEIIDAKFGEESFGEEELMMAAWIDGEWWVADECVDFINEDDSWNIPFKKFEKGFFGIKGWAPLWCGCDVDV